MTLAGTWYVLLLCAASPLGVAQDEAEEAASPEDAAVETEGPAQLLERGREAFSANDFAAAEEALEKFIVDYGEAEEAKEAVRIHRPLVAIAKVGLRKFGEALEWIDQSLRDPEIDAMIADELRFWRGICLMTEGQLVDAQRAFGAYWADESHQAFKRYEALLLFATLYVQQDFPEVAADFLADQIPKIRDRAAEAASRGIVLQLYARIQAGQTDLALDLLREEYHGMGEMTQVISFQTLALQLGADFLEKEEWYHAIACLQRIWLSERLLDHQGDKVSQIEERISSLETRPNTRGTVFQLEAILKRVDRELENFRRIEHFDSALRLRLAMAFQGLGRYREAALIMEEMLATMAPDPVVESATLAQLQCWMEIARWPKAVEAAERYEEVFGADGEHLATVLFLKAEALRENEELGRARLAYGKVVERFPEDPFAPKALFMQGFLYLQEDDNDGALYQFDQVKRRYPDSGMVEDADYWTGMAYSFAGLYPEAREHLRAYPERHEAPKYRKEAIFRVAVCTFSLAEYEEAIPLLLEFNEAYPGDALTDEANLLLGDAYLGGGAIDEGFAAYDRVRPESGRFFEEAWFKKGNAYKLLEEFETMRAHFAAFVEDHPESGRMPEAVYWIGWTHLNAGEPEKARDIYWQTIEEHGDDPDMTTVTDVFAGLPKVYDGASGKEDLLARLQTTRTRAEVADEPTLAARAGWAKSLVAGSENPLAARTELLAIAKWIDPKLQSPVVSVPVAEALLDAGNTLTAKTLFTEIRRWHPRAVQKDRVYRALGDIATDEGEPEKAIGFYERFEREALASTLLGDVRLRKAALQKELGRTAAARGTLESILETEGVDAATKAEALMALGESFAEAGEHGKAVVYFERLYVAYGKFGELNARAYWNRARSLEALDLKREALETYEELASRDDLRRFDEAGKAAPKIESLRRLFPDESPSGGEEVSL
ncbi:MAG: tetratricopeptide repeat protein [Verrucomicrobiales bacterium]